jgi:hypothetical protein
MVHCHGMRCCSAYLPVCIALQILLLHSTCCNQKA